MHPQYPIECKCSHRGEHFQLAFARKAIEILPRSDETSLKPSAEGLTVLAETEIALERPLKVLREVYGDDVHIEPPRVRYQQAATVEEPYMGLRVLCGPQHFDAVRRDLRLRHAAIMDAEVNRQFGVVRASAPLAMLVGYPARVRHLTSGQAQLVMWLSHYAPVEDTPPDGHAA